MDNANKGYNLFLCIRNDAGTTTVVSSGTYADWAAGFTSLDNTDLALDFEGDGLPTGIEWVVGGDPTLNDGAGLAPTVVATDESALLFIFRRTVAARDDANTRIEVEYCSDLSTWRNNLDHGVADSVTTTVDPEGFGVGVDRVTVAIPWGLEVDNALFARLKVTVSP